MRIYSMTATFGKLENQTLTFEPGMNVIHAPNEWGKSTWCAFLTAMLYGMDTRAKSSKTVLAEKERYAPWSGSPMEGSIRLNWQGRDITIERKTKRRVPLGEFRAYETDTGLDVPELTAANCGSMLLGVERSVFVRSGFIRFSDLPLTQDDALRRRLNALVTTGDESATGDRLAGALRDLKNNCRYHKSGLLPQAETERDKLENTLVQMRSCEENAAGLQLRLTQLHQWLTELENHDTALRYQASREDAGKVARAEQALAEARDAAAEAEARCKDLPDQEQIRCAIQELHRLEQQCLDLQMETNMMGRPPEQPEAPQPFRGMTGLEAASKAAEDVEQYRKLTQKKPLLSILAGILLALGVGLAFWKLIPGLILGIVGAAALIALLIKQNGNRKKAGELASSYPDPWPDGWISLAHHYSNHCQSYEYQLRKYRETCGELEARGAQLREKIRQATGDRGLTECRRYWEQADRTWSELAEARRRVPAMEENLQVLRSVVKTAEAPAFPDTLTYSKAETARMLSDVRSDLADAQNKLSQYQGRIEQLGSRQDLLDRLAEVNARIERLEKTYNALNLAQETLTRASAQLQRRFAPKITGRAQELMSAFTAGRYERLSLAEDLSVRAGTGEEATLREAMWRSDGTVDQLYLALRLAVAQELLPHAPLILDDALVRFDDQRLESALQVLKAIGQERQVLLFTCHDRERKLMN